MNWEYMKIYILTVLLSVLTASCMAQTDRQYIRSGNRYFRQQDFIKAESEYRKAISKNSENTQALYNLGCALLMQKKDSMAISQFEKVGKLEKNPLRRSKSLHNIGFICQSHRLYGDAIKAYEESLRDNPSDDETRYNLALCKRLNKQQNKQDKKNDKQDKSQNKNNDKQKQNEQKQEKQKQDNQQEKMSKDNAEQLLNAAMQSEQATQRRMKDAMRKSSSRKLDKNW